MQNFAADLSMQGNDSLVFNAPLFAELMNHVRRVSGCNVMDLGQVRSATIDLFNQFNCRLTIINLHEHVAGSMSEDHVDVAATLADIHSLPDDETFDVILIWDLLNYLDKDSIQQLVQSLTGRLKRGAMVHALIQYSTDKMAAVPHLYDPQIQLADNEERILNQMKQVVISNEVMTAPQYSPETLKKCMRGFEIHKAMLLGNGMQEFLFIKRGR